MKDRDISGLNFDGENLIIDLRYKIPKESCSYEFLKDLMEMKNDFINGSFYHDSPDRISDGCNYFIKYKAKIQEDENGNDTVIFTKNFIELN